MNQIEIEKTLKELKTEVQQIKERIKQIEYKFFLKKRYLTIKEVSDYTGYTESTIYHLTGRKKIRYHKPNGKTILIKRKDLEKWIESHPVEIMDELRAEPFPINKPSNSNQNNISDEY